VCLQELSYFENFVDDELEYQTAHEDKAVGANLDF
jgi:hypothetical protein